MNYKGKQELKDKGFQRQTTSTVLMIRPLNFGYNEQTALTNAFQVAPEPQGAKTIQEKALQEFDDFVEGLKKSGMEVITFNDTPSPYTPDSIFPNNWITFHEDGRIVLYPMEAHNRRLERKTQIISALESEYGFEISEIIDLSYFEKQDKYLEGTGSMILDRQNKIVYACLSTRTSPEVLELFCAHLGYTSICFQAFDQNDVPIYHTNVLMAVGEKIAIACLESISNEKEKENLLNSLLATGKTIVEISLKQMLNFAGNMLELKTTTGKPLLVMSKQGYESLTVDQINKIEAQATIFYADISHIEKYGGGSARCMMAEIFNPRKGS
ncbi:MAG: amidinotransferase [Bacteroidetes bacterium]|nr:amidinotransferase [Bacteroidota bacterium]HET6244364.1 arginine deiminase-related protein [Bacteroidia bacterium]